MISRADLIVLLCGACTFLLRFLPMWQVRRRGEARAVASGPLPRLFRGIGPAAIAALLVVALWPALVSNFRVCSALATGLALATIVVVKFLHGGVAARTLAGAIVYGLLMSWFGG